MIRPRTLPVLEQCIAQGLRFGWQRAHGGGAPPNTQQVWESQLRAILDEVYEWFELDGEAPISLTPRSGEMKAVEP